MLRSPFDLVLPVEDLHVAVLESQVGETEPAAQSEKHRLAVTEPAERLTLCLCVCVCAQIHKAEPVRLIILSGVESIHNWTKDFLTSQAMYHVGVCVGGCVPPLHALHERHLIRRRGDVEGGGLALVDAVLDAVHRLLLLHLHRVTQAQGPKEQLLVLLEEEWGGGGLEGQHNVGVKLKKENQIQKKKEVCAHSGFGTR